MISFIVRRYYRRPVSEIDCKITAFHRATLCFPTFPCVSLPFFANTCVYSCFLVFPRQLPFLSGHREYYKSYIHKKEPIIHT